MIQNPEHLLRIFISYQRGSFSPSLMFLLLTLLFSLQQAPVWEITGAEFSKSEMHTADGISIRFPRMTRIRDDKDWKSATNLHQLKVGFYDSDSALCVLVFTNE